MNAHKIYFASDFHLGIPDHSSSLLREKRVVQWLEFVSSDASDIYLVGDLFDFWFEYNKVVPKGFVRLLGKLAELTDKGIRIHIFHGNHDLWQFGYFEKELGCKVYHTPITITLNAKVFHIAHGDGLGPGQSWFKFVLSVYRNRFFQRLFAFFHPSIGIGIANWVSHRSKQQSFESNKTYLGDDKEYLMQYAKQMLQQQQIDYFIFGHRHLPFHKYIQNSAVFNLGDWFSYNTYVVFDGNKAELKTFNPK